jgi:hypothetical protein
MFQAGHVASVFKFLAMFAYNKLDISYEDFYDHILSLPSIQDILSLVYELFNQYMFEDKQNKFIQYKNLQMNVDNYIYLKCIENLDKIYNEINIEFGEEKTSLFEFQKFILLNINDKRECIELEYDYKDYFKNILTLPAFKKTEREPIKIKTLYKRDFKVGLHKHIDTREITSLEMLNDKIFSVASNWRHKLFYHSGVLEN